MTPEIIPGPHGSRLIIHGNAGCWRIGFDALEANRCGASHPVGAKPFGSRDQAVADASRRIRHAMSDHLTPAHEAWLKAASERQPDLFTSPSEIQS